MAQYLAMRIQGGYLEYESVVHKFPQFKDEIDEYLVDMQL